MLQVLNSLAVAVALYPILVASSMHKVRHSSDLAVRDPMIPTVIDVRASNEMNKRDDPPIPYSYSLLGCIDEIDNWPVRVLNHQITDWDGVSPSSCINDCWNSGPIDGSFGPHYIFAGLVNGTQCWCDITINVNAQPVDQSRCDHTCINGPNENCGGSREYLMYTLDQTNINPYTANPAIIPIIGEGSAQFYFRGCFPDSPENRALVGYTITSDDMTPARCAGHCWEQSYTWAGVEYGNQCFCSNFNNAAGTAVALSNCAQACSGDSFYSCGAPNFIDVYQSGTGPRDTLPQ